MRSDYLDENELYELLNNMKNVGLFMLTNKRTVMLTYHSFWQLMSGIGDLYLKYVRHFLSCKHNHYH